MTVGAVEGEVKYITDVGDSNTRVFWYEVYGECSKNNKKKMRTTNIHRLKVHILQKFTRFTA